MPDKSVPGWTYVLGDQIPDEFVLGCTYVLSDENFRSVVRSCFESRPGISGINIVINLSEKIIRVNVIYRDDAISYVMELGLYGSLVHKIRTLGFRHQTSMFPEGTGSTTEYWRREK